VVPADDFDGAGRDAEGAGQRADEFFVGRSLGGRGGDANSQRAVVPAGHLAARRARDDADGEAESVACFHVVEHGRARIRRRK
jgi:hypothetical protein